MRDSLKARNAETQRAIELGTEALTDFYRIQACLERLEEEVAALKSRIDRKAVASCSANH
jgi:hypothetical protein